MHFVNLIILSHKMFRVDVQKSTKLKLHVTNTVVLFTKVDEKKSRIKTHKFFVSKSIKRVGLITKLSLYTYLYGNNTTFVGETL